MKKIVLSFSLLFSCLLLNAQSKFGTVKYQKNDIPSVLTEYRFQEDITLQAITNYFENKGYKAKSSKGASVFQGVNIPELGSETLDVYVFVDRKSRKEKEVSTVAMSLSKAAGTFVSDSSDAGLIEKTQKFLDDVISVSVKAYDIDVQIKQQESVVNKNENKFKDLTDDAQKLLRKKTELEKAILDNNAAQTAQKTEVDKQKQILEVLKQKRKAVDAKTN